MANLAPAALLKYDWRIELFLKKYKNNETFELVNGTNIKFLFVKSTYDQFLTKDINVIKKATLIDKSGKEYSLSSLKKNAEFGGKGERFGVIKEDAEVESLRKQILEAKAKLASPTVPILVNNIKYDVFDVESTPGTPKSDFHFTDINGKEIVWISHKDGSTAKDFQQWGGISQRNEPTIFAHKEVQQFIKDLKEKYPNGLPNATSVYRKINDEKLKMLSVYGNEYLKNAYSRQNVTIMLQGSSRLIKNGASYSLTATHTHANGDKMTGLYEPVLTAIYKGDRSDAGVKGTRIVIMPIGGRKMTETI